MSEIAFTVMDLQHRSHPEFAWRLLNAYLEANGDYGGIPVLRFYLAYRAAVRAKVCAIRAGQAGLSRLDRTEELAACRSYLALARQSLERFRPALIITHGLPGSGKTTFSQLALQQMGGIRIRSDVERKRLFGLGTLEDSRIVGDIYGAEATRRTYARLLELARGIMQAGFPAIVDAAFLRREEREAFRQLAESLSVPFAIASLHAGDDTLRERIRHAAAGCLRGGCRGAGYAASKATAVIPGRARFCGGIHDCGSPGQRREFARLAQTCETAALDISSIRTGSLPGMTCHLFSLADNEAVKNVGEADSLSLKFTFATRGNAMKLEDVRNISKSRDVLSRESFKPKSINVPLS